VTAHGHAHGGGHSHGLVDASIKRSRAGVRAVSLSLMILLATSVAQAVVFFSTSSVALLADLIHNVGDALTALPLGAAFLLRSYKAEKRAGYFVVATIFVSACVAFVEAISRLVNPQPIDHLTALALAGVVGFVGNEIAAVVRLRAGKRLSSPCAGLSARGVEPQPAMHESALDVDAHHAVGDADDLRYIGHGAVAEAVQIKGDAAARWEFGHEAADELQLLAGGGAALGGGLLGYIFERIDPGFLEPRVRGTLAGAIDGEIGGEFEQVGAQEADGAGGVELEHADVGFLGDLLGFLLGIDSTQEEPDQCLVMFAEQAQDQLGAGLAGGWCVGGPGFRVCAGLLVGMLGD